MTSLYKFMLKTTLIFWGICATMIIVAISIQVIALKWILWIFGIIAGLIGLLLTFIAITENRKEIKEQGVLGDCIKASFIRKLKNPNYRQNIISKITYAINNEEEFRISNEDICRIFIDINKAELNLPKSLFNQINKLHSINTTEELYNLKAEEEQQNELRPFSFRSDHYKEQQYRHIIKNEENYYALLISVLTPYHKIASIEHYTYFNKFETAYIIEQIEKAENEHKSFIKEIYEVVNPTVNYDEKEIEKRLLKLTEDQKDRISMQLENIYNMRADNKTSAEYLKNNTIEKAIFKAKNNQITQKEFGELGIYYLLYKRKYNDTKPEKIQEKIDWIIEMLNYDRKRDNYVCGTMLMRAQGENYISPKDEWHQKVTESLANINNSNNTFKYKVATLYELTEHIFNLFQVDPPCETEKNDNSKIENAILKVFEEEYLKLSSGSISDNIQNEEETSSNTTAKDRENELKQIEKNISSLKQTYQNAVRDIGDVKPEDIEHAYTQGLITKEKFTEIMNSYEVLQFMIQSLPLQIETFEQKRLELLNK